MCDTLCVVRPSGALFAKNSDRPSSEVQLIEALPGRASGGTLRTQYLDLPDTGAFAMLNSRPDWLWGLEHGVNECRVAIGNEKVWTTLDPAKEPAALIGMDLVRLGLERACSADEALAVMTTLLEEYGQGGLCDQTTGESYFSSFIIADPRGGWVLETSGRSWVAAPVRNAAAISNRLTLRTEWTRSSADVVPGTDWDTFRHPAAPTAHADVRLAASRACIAGVAPGALTPADLAAHLRDHGTGPWGAPGDNAARVSLPPGEFRPDGTGVSVCMHIRGFQNTTSSIIAELPADPETPMRAWVAPGNPCVSLFLPVFPPYAVPTALADPATWRALTTLRDHVEADSSALPEIRAVFAPLESELWCEADEIATQTDRHDAFVQLAWKRVSEALNRLRTLG
ncbi:MAG: C69 family dipeptidase [Dehalococcoidia bacterium]